MGCAQQILMSEGGAFVPFSTTYTTPGTSTIAVPTGASFVSIECIGGGAGGNYNGGTISYGGGGGAYSLTSSQSLSGITGIYISVPAAAGAGSSGGDCFAKANTSGGTTLCLAKGGLSSNNSAGTGGSADSGIGTTKYSGGHGDFEASSIASSGGGAAGRTGAGGNASVGTGGTGNSPGGNGGTSGAIGSNYGGGSGSLKNTTVGTQGWLVLSWT